MKILTVVGARPQFVKASVVSMSMAQNGIEEIIVHTGQHYDENMSDIFFSQMQIPKPAYRLHLGNLSHGEMTGRMIEEIEALILKVRPESVLVYGDTNSTLATAIAASKTPAKLIHIEAGLRSFNLQMPEEINRIVTDRLSDMLFCPTAASVLNLKNEGFETLFCKSGNKIRIELVGDVMKDSAAYFSTYAAENCSTLISSLSGDVFALCTLHRAENVKNKDRLHSIFRGLNAIGKSMEIVLPLHPGTREAIKKFEVHVSKHVRIIEPVGFFDMLLLLQKCAVVLTDSGGVQKEAFFFKKPCVTLRSETEWVELVENGYALLSGSDPDVIENCFHHAQEIDFSAVKPLFGQGSVSNKIVDIILNKTVSMAPVPAELTS